MWVATKTIRSHIQKHEISFLQSMSGLSLKDRMRGSVICEGL